MENAGPFSPSQSASDLKLRSKGAGLFYVVIPIDHLFCSMPIFTFLFVSLRCITMTRIFVKLGCGSENVKCGISCCSIHASLPPFTCFWGHSPVT